MTRTEHRIGISLYNYPTEQMVRLGQLADRFGFDSVWLGDHVLTPHEIASAHPHGGAHTTVVDAVNDFSSATVVAAAILAATQDIRVAFGVLILPLRHPLLVARDVISLAQLAPGRLTLGVGAGWLAEEFYALEVLFADRVKRLEESVHIIRQACAGGTNDYVGECFSYPPLTLTSRPVQVPIFFGGTADAALRRAALLGEGWYSPGGESLEACVDVRRKIESVRAEEACRVTSPTFRYVVRVPPETFPRFSAAGFRDLVLDGGCIFQAASPLDEKVAALKDVARRFGLTARASHSV